MTGRKDDYQKPRFDLMPPLAELAVARVLTFGAGKYGAENWREVPDARQRYYAAARRHMNAYWCGDKVDGETGEPHLAHAACCLLFMLQLDEEQGAVLSIEDIGQVLGVYGHAD